MSQRHFVEASGISSDRRHYLSFALPAREFSSRLCAYCYRQSVSLRRFAALCSLVSDIELSHQSISPRGTS